MSGTNIGNDLLDKVIEFHGHWCPGLATGIRAAEWAVNELGRAADEEIVAVVETDMCGVDAIQYLTGCTFGKGNLIYQDYGKNAFTFYRRRDGKAARLVMRPGINMEEGRIVGRLHQKREKSGLTEEEQTLWADTRAKMSENLMNADFETLFDVKEPQGPAPKKARVLASLICDDCGEPVMESKTRRMHNKTLCLPCFDILEKRI